MVALYLVASEEGTGKTTLAAGLAKHFLSNGKKVGFLKPVFAEQKAEGDTDAAFMKQALALPEQAGSLSPLIGGEKRLADRIREVYIEVAQNKDVVIIEGRCRHSPDDSLSKAAYEIAGALKAKVIAVEGFTHKASTPRFVNSYKGFGENLLGMVLNKVPKSRQKRVCEEITGKFGESELRILGVIPEDRVLFTLTIGELAESINGEILNNAERSAELVENIMVQVMAIDSGLEYFGRKANKAAVAKDDRPDMQMAALETSTRCLVISGGTAPSDYVRFKAENKGIPIILTRNNVNTVVQNIEDALEKARFAQEKKSARLAEILEQNLDFQTIDKGLGLAK